jgi:hypothetical protein
VIKLFDDEPEPVPSQTLLVPWDEKRLRRTVERDEWIGCWKVGPGGYLEFFADGTARQKFVSRGGSGDFGGTVTWEWIDPRVIRIRHKPGQGDESVGEYRVIRFDGKKLWTECKSLDGPAQGIELSVFLFKAPRPKSWR